MWKMLKLWRPTRFRGITSIAGAHLAARRPAPASPVSGDTDRRIGCRRVPLRTIVRSYRSGCLADMQIELTLLSPA
ncbi:MAG: hypothetical protein ACTSQV_02165, partial [Alphaproteobacteria bacterium]